MKVLFTMIAEAVVELPEDEIEDFKQSIKESPADFLDDEKVEIKAYHEIVLENDE